MKNTTKLLLIFFISLFSGCDDMLDKEPLGAFTNVNYYQTQQQVELGSLWPYKEIVNPHFSFAWPFFEGIISDDGFYGDFSGNADRIQLENFNVTSDNVYIRDIWKTMYNVIQASNTILSRSTQVEMNQVLRDHISGEMYFFRAFAYFRLVRLYGDVPLVLTETNTTDESALLVSKSPADQIYIQIMSDLDKAIELLPETRPNRDLGRVTKGAALSEKMRVAMTLQNWAMAVELGESIIDLGYELVPNYSNIFRATNEQNPEIIWSLVINGQAGGTSNWIPNAQGPRIGSSPEAGDGSIIPTSRFAANIVPGQDSAAWARTGIWEAYEDTDPRRTANFITQTSDGAVLSKPHYIKWYTPGSSRRRDPQDIIMTRFGDILLLYIEAINELNGPTAVAQFYLNQIRYRARTSAPYTASQPSPASSLQDVSPSLTKDQFRLLIYRERRKELANEFHRWFDLLRTGRALEVMRAHGKEIDASDLIMPIPQSEIDRNPNLK